VARLIKKKKKESSGRPVSVEWVFVMDTTPRARDEGDAIPPVLHLLQ
jgi:hypothetical protein